MNKKLAAEFISFADSELESFQMDDREDVLKIYLTSWDERTLCMIFSNPIYFNYKLGDAIGDFYEILDNSQLLNEALALQYVKMPASDPFKLFQIWDINDFPFISIVAKSVIVTKGKEITGFRS